jgi:hypothetical protein
MTTPPVFVGKRMRELLEGASICIIPFPQKDDYFGTTDEKLGTMTRHLFIGYEHPNKSELLWSLYFFKPTVGDWEYSIKLAPIVQYYELIKDGPLSDEDSKKYEHIVSQASETPTRKNGMLWGFVVEDDNTRQNIENQLIPTMKINTDLSDRYDIKEFIETICEKAIPDMKPNKLNIWGDYNFLWNDFGFFVDFKFLCVGGIERARSYPLITAYARNIPWKK